MANELQIDPAEIEAADRIAFGLHKQAFFGRLADHGEVPETEAEAEELLKLGFDLLTIDPRKMTTQVKEASNSAPDRGFYGHLRAGVHRLMGRDVDNIAPGFKRASAKPEQKPSQLPDLPQSLKEAAWEAAWDLAHDPDIYRAAVIKLAQNGKIDLPPADEASDSD